MKLSMIVAMSKNGVIGNNGGLPWERIPEDMALFRRLTMGKPVIMGRATWNSLDKPLKGRRNIILSRSLNLTEDQYHGPDRIHVVRTPIEAIHASYAIRGTQEAFVIGGAEVYRIFGPMCDEAHVTVVHRDVQGDVYLPIEVQEPWVLAAPGEWIAKDVAYRRYVRKS